MIGWFENHELPTSPSISRIRALLLNWHPLSWEKLHLYLSNYTWMSLYTAATYALCKLWSNMEITDLFTHKMHLFPVCSVTICMLLSNWVTVPATVSKCERTALYWTFRLTWNTKWKFIHSYPVNTSLWYHYRMIHESWCYSSLRLERTMFV